LVSKTSSERKSQAYHTAFGLVSWDRRSNAAVHVAKLPIRCLHLRVLAQSRVRKSCKLNLCFIGAKLGNQYWFALPPCPPAPNAQDVGYRAKLLQAPASAVSTVLVLGESHRRDRHQTSTTLLTVPVVPDVFNLRAVRELGLQDSPESNVKHGCQRGIAGT